MADLNDFNKTDLVDDHLAADYNRVLAGAVIAETVNTETITATKELADSDCPLQAITASGADRTVELPPEATTNHFHIIKNAGGSNNVVVKDDSGGTTYHTLAPGGIAFYVPIGLTWMGFTTVQAASTVISGIVELATNAEAITGTDADRAVTPAALAAVLAALTAADIPITDAGSFFTATDTEAALQEIMTRYPAPTLKAADETVNNSAALQDDADFAFAIAANAIWSVELFLVVTAANATADFKFDFTGPAGCSAYYGLAHNSGVLGWGMTDTSGTPTGLATALATAVGVGSINGTIGVLITGIFINGATAGTIQLRWAQNTANASNTVVKQNSFMRRVKLA